MAFSKIILNGTTLMDVTDTTAEASQVKTGEIFYTAGGLKSTGTFEGHSSVIYQDSIDAAGGTVRNIIVDEQFDPGKFFDMDWPTGVVTSTATSIQQYAISGRTGITHLYLPNLIEIPSNGFRNCTSIQTIDTPARFASYAQNIFYGCSSLTGFVNKTTTARTLANECFRGCTNLTYVDLMLEGTSQSNGFYDCTNLKTVILRRSLLAGLGNVNWFTNTPFAQDGSGGTLYVPSDLKSSYESATNWSTILAYPNNQIKTIEGSIYETHYADGTQIPTT